MPDKNSVSPLLDGLRVGNPISSHFGAVCYPALEDSTGDRYIVKSLSIPQSQAQLDALLITGACNNAAEAASYFRKLADETAAEAALLNKLSAHDGFLAFDGYQIVPSDNGGSCVYLRSPYRVSLERYMRRHSVSHLDAVNLGIDLCAALTACRSLGFLYVDLKPSNIFLTPRKEFKIGDLGFVPKISLKYTPLPNQYRSPYSAPEVLDDLNVLNETVDTYSVGMLLYQIFNFGRLPAVGQELPPPANGDPEINDILLRACHPDPSKRWEHPHNMWQALVAYMQRNTINNTQIMAPLAPASNTSTIAKFRSAEDAPVVTAPPVPEQPEEPVPTTEEEAEHPEEPSVDTPTEEIPVEESDVQESPEADSKAVPEEVPEGVPEIGSETVPDAEPEVPAEEVSEDLLQEASEEAEPAENSAAESNPALEIIKVMSEKLAIDELNEESTQIQLESAKLPDVPAPETPSIILEADPVSQDYLENLRFDSEEEKADFDSELEEVSRLINTNLSSMPKLTVDAAGAPAKESAPPKEKKHNFKKFFTTVLVLILLALVGFLGFAFYENYYVQTVDALTVDGTGDSLTVTVQSDIPDELLTVVCVDSYGTATEQPVLNGQAVFTGLTPGSLYKLQVKISGLHSLNGAVSEIYTTDSVANVVSFTAITGSGDSSAVLSFAVDGYDPAVWQVVITSATEERTQTFSGHTVTVTDLNVGEAYTFRLETNDGTSVTGKNTLEFSVSGLVLAKELQLASAENGNLEIVWKAPADAQVDSWKVRCYASNYDETQEVTEPRVVFTGTDSNQAYTVEVTAAGMTESAKLTVDANPVTLSEVKIAPKDNNEITIDWKHSGTAPEGGWLLTYSIDGVATPEVIQCEDTHAVISPRIPGASYRFTIATPDSVPIFNNEHTYNCPKAEMFVGHAVSAYKFSADLLPTPEAAKWVYYSVTDDFTTEFAPGADMSLVLKVSINFYLDNEPVFIMYVVRDADGKVVPELTVTQEANWAHLWAAQDYHYAELNATKAPTIPGNYTLDVYFDGAIAVSNPFTVS